MKSLLIAAALMASLASAGLVGCAEKVSSTKEETTLSTPDGTTKTTTETTVKKTGDNPPSTTK